MQGKVSSHLGPQSSSAPFFQRIRENCSFFLSFFLFFPQPSVSQAQVQNGFSFFFFFYKYLTQAEFQNVMFLFYFFSIIEIIKNTTEVGIILPWTFCVWWPNFSNSHTQPTLSNSEPLLFQSKHLKPNSIVYMLRDIFKNPTTMHFTYIFKQ